MKEVALTKGKVALVDDEDFERVNKFKWRLSAHGYALTNCPRENGHRKTILLHRFLLGASKNTQVDHIDGNRLNDRRNNLRACTGGENTRNQCKQRRNTSSKFKGVYWDRTWNRWVAQIGINKKRIRIGYFMDEESAARAYNKAAKTHHGIFAKLNDVG